jgi:hypothetical protein
MAALRKGPATPTLQADLITFTIYRPIYSVTGQVAPYT